MSHEPPEHLKDKYRCYAIWLATDYGSRPISDMLIVHLGRPMSFLSFVELYILQHQELTIEKTGQKIQTVNITGIQKIDNNNIPKYELTYDGVLLDMV